MSPPITSAAQEQYQHRQHQQDLLQHHQQRQQQEKQRQEKQRQEQQQQQQQHHHHQQQQQQQQQHEQQLEKQEKQKQLRLRGHGHSSRALVLPKRRHQIWEQFHMSFKERIPPYKWCTRQELVAVSCSGEGDIKFTIDELTEVIRGKKHKRDIGIDSQKVDGEWLYRFIPMDGVVKVPPVVARPAPPATGKHRALSSTTKPKRPKPKANPTPKKPNATPKKPNPTPRKRKVPLRPKAKSPAVSPAPMAVVTTGKATEQSLPSSSRKRPAPSSSPSHPANNRPRTEVKRSRSSPPGGGGGGLPTAGGTAAEHSKSDSERASTANEVLRVGGSGGGEKEKDGSWSCSVM